MEIVKFEQYLKQNHLDIVVAIGQFDGFHLAHQVLLNKVIEIGDNKKYKKAIITFNPHPDFVLNKTTEDVYLTTVLNKAEILAKLGFDYMIIINFDNRVANTSPIDFVNDYLIRIGVKEVVVGYDFHFGCKGYGRADMIETLSNNQIKVSIIDEIKYNEQKLGSSLIKKLLLLGDIKHANMILGRPYRIEGRVVTGRKIGRTINIPTANIQFSNKYSKVKNGVYGVIVKHLESEYIGIANYGNNPSFNYQSTPVLEVHIIDYDGDLYGELLKIDFIIFLRDEMIFDNKHEFIKQISIDKERAILEIKPLLDKKNNNTII